MKVTVATAVRLDDIGVGYGIGLTEAGDKVEFIGDWRDMQLLRQAIELAGPQPAEVEHWQVLMINGAANYPLPRAAMAARASFMTEVVRLRR